MEPRPRRLSPAQKALLVRLYDATQRATADARGAGWVRYGPAAGASHPDQERSHAASVSRTLRRLADRGLVERGTWGSGLTSRHITHVRLTDDGLALAAQLHTTQGEHA